MLASNSERRSPNSLGVDLKIGVYHFAYMPFYQLIKYCT
jgi:hypothetical protein